MASNTPESLIKFCTANTAHQILAQQKLRWSAPYLFSDPFELNHETQLNFDPQSLLKAAIQTAAGLIFSKEVPRGSTPLMAAIRRWRDEERFGSPDEAESVLRDLLAQVVDHRQSSIDQMMTDWRKFARTLRICSFSGKPDNLSAWQHFADSHRGVAIRFRCGEYTALPAPERVIYRSSRPEITTLKQQLDVVINSERFVAQDHFYEKVTTKPIFCSSEDEWRCFTQAEDTLNSTPTTKDWYQDKKFERSEIEAIYFGIYTPTKVKRAIYELIKENYAQAKIYQARAVTGEYDLAFDRIAARK